MTHPTTHHSAGRPAIPGPAGPPAQVGPGWLHTGPHQTTRPTTGPPVPPTPTRPAPPPRAATVGEPAPLTHNDARTDAAQRPGLPGSGAGVGLAARVRAWAVREAGALRFVDEPVACLRDQIAWARAGDWTARPAGKTRDAMGLWVRLVAIPVTMLALFVAWSVRTPGRAAAVLGSTVLVTTVLNLIPAVAWVIPDWSTVPYWLPFL